MSEMAWIEAHLEAVKQDTEIVSEALFAGEALEKHAFETFMSTYMAGVKAIGEEPAVTIGSIVAVEDLQEGDEFDIQIVSPSDDADQGLVMAASYLSSVGRALLLKRIGETVSVKTPQGKVDYLIKNIKKHPA